MRTLLFLLWASTLSAAPNVIVIFADDLGYGDLGCYGAKDWATPRLDALAKQSVRFTDFYAAQPVCSASRAGLLTGCYPNRIGIGGALSPFAKIGISENETTLAEVFKSRGYRTGMVGKWHLGHHPKFLPTKHGFDTWLGLPYSNDMWPRHPTAKAGSYPKLPLFDGEKVIDDDVDEKDQESLTERYTQRAVEFIKASKDPYFLYVAFSMPHVPLYTTAEFRGKTKSAYGDIIQEIDHRVGQILDAAGPDTIVLFTSDNGPWVPYGDHAGTTGGLRGAKGSTWEGGVRVPCILRWPGVAKPDSTCSAAVMTIDVLPTLAKTIGAAVPNVDGVDLKPLLDGSKESVHESLAFYYQANALEAVRAGKWKLVLPHNYPQLQTPGSGGKPGKTTPMKVEQPELYDLAADRNETTNVAATNPDVMKTMMDYVETYRADLGDSLTNRVGFGRREPGKVP